MRLHEGTPRPYPSQPSLPPEPVPLVEPEEGQRSRRGRNGHVCVPHTHAHTCTTVSWNSIVKICEVPTPHMVPQVRYGDSRVSALH